MGAQEQEIRGRIEYVSRKTSHQDTVVVRPRCLRCLPASTSEYCSKMGHSQIFLHAFSQVSDLAGQTLQRAVLLLRRFAYSFDWDECNAGCLMSNTLGCDSVQSFQYSDRHSNVTCSLPFTSIHMRAANITWPAPR
jgi:hypothetical protein